MLLVARQSRHRTGKARRPRGADLLAGGGVGAALAYFLDRENGRRRRHMLRDRTLAIGRRGGKRTVRRVEYAVGTAAGLGHRVGAAVRDGQHDYDDVTLARKVESEIFRPADAPKGSVNVNVHDGVVELRGEVRGPEEIAALGNATARVAGVRRVENLLHTPGSPPKHSPVSDPQEVRRRAAD
jgi:hypothetical protein